MPQVVVWILTLYKVIHKDIAPTSHHTGKKGQFPQRHWHPASWKLKNKRRKCIVRFRFMWRAFTWIGPQRERKAREEASKEMRLPSLFCFLSEFQGWFWSQSKSALLKVAHVQDPGHGADGWAQSKHSARLSWQTESSLCVKSYIARKHSHFVSCQLVNRKLILLWHSLSCEPLNRPEQSLAAFFYI